MDTGYIPDRSLFIYLSNMGKRPIKYYSYSTLNMEAVFSTETVVSIHQIEWRSNPEDNNSQSEGRENAHLQKCLISHRQCSWREKESNSYTVTT